MSDSADPAVSLYARWTSAEIGTLCALLQSGLSNAEIAVIMKRAPSGVGAKAYQVGPRVWPNRSGQQINEIRSNLLRERERNGDYRRPVPSRERSAPTRCDGVPPEEKVKLEPRRCTACRETFRPKWKHNRLCEGCTSNIAHMGMHDA